MLKAIMLAAATCLLHVAAASAQTSQLAKPDESCQGFYNGCHAWCRQNTHNAANCTEDCTNRHRTCLSDGTWPLKQGTIRVYGLPAKPGEKPVEPLGN